MKKKKLTGENIFQFTTSLIFIIIMVVVMIPLIRVLSVSFSSKGAILSGRVLFYPVEFTDDAYMRVFDNLNFIKSFLYSIILMIGSTGLAMLMTILAAYPLSKKGLKGGSIIMTLFVLTMYFDPGIIPNYLNVKSLHLVDTVWALVLPGALSAYNLIILRTFFLGIDKSLFEAAYIDGCSQFRALFSIAIPLAVPAIATLSLFYAVSRWNGISDVLYYVNKSSLYTVQMTLKQMIDSIKISQLEGQTTNLVAENIKAASIIISMTPMMIAYPFIQKYFKKGIMLGAVKG